MKLLSKAAAVVGFALMAGTASAAVVNFDFTSSGNNYSWTKSFTVDGVTVGVSAYNYTPAAGIGDDVALGGQIGVSQSTPGLGACSAATSPNDNNCGKNPLVDAGTAPELLKFTFSEDVTITGILYANNDQNDHVDYFFGPALTFAGGFLTPQPPSRQDLSSYGPLSLFALGNQTPSDQYRIAGLQIETSSAPVVPLPASALLLMGGVGGLAALRRRKKA
ncbi:VPLPA-CTERM sorting domain-containing protein [Paracoccus sp. (in: a-proteobacteria)]|uniref:VPLPA-CTERM sorting domain-containing protein n=1 Tax=Paracoccus sp. TaxID=267 RepID=UPI003A89BE73